MRRPLFCLLALVLLVACRQALSPEEQATLVAKQYYDRLLQSDYDAFMDGKDGADTLPADYRSQLRRAYERYMAEQTAKHQGIRAVRTAAARGDTAQHVTYAFLVLCYGDSTNEEITVPMVERNGRWLMK